MTDAVPLYSSDAEQAVLSAVLMDTASLRPVRPMLRAEDFFVQSHARLYAAQLALADRGDRIDPITLADELLRRGELEAVGGKDYIGFLVDVAPTSLNAEYHARIVADRAQRRALIERAERAQCAAADLAINPVDAARGYAEDLSRYVAAVDGERLPRATRASEAPDPQPPRWIIDGVWPRSEIGMTVGDGGSFKSSASIHIAAAVAGGYPVFGQFVTHTEPVLIVSAEDDQDTIMMRLLAIIRGEGWDERAVLDRFHIIANPDATLADRSWQSHISREVARTGAGFVVLDPLAELIDGDESSNSEMRRYVKFVRRLTRDFGASINIVHHAGKMAQGKRMIDRIRGASAFASASRTILFLDFQPEGVRVTHLKNSRAPVLESFVLRPHIRSNPHNRAEWITATIACVDQNQPRAVPYGQPRPTGVDLTSAESFVVAQVMVSPRTLGSEQLKQAGLGIPGLSAKAISDAIASLQAQGRLDFEQGKQGKKLWFLRLPENLGNLGNLAESTLPRLPKGCPGNLEGCQPDLAPLGGQGRQPELEDVASLVEG